MRGIVARHRPVAPCGFNAAGAAWGDADADGDLDLFLPQQAGPSELWLNDGRGRFRERARELGVADAGFATAAAFADYDDDGDQDLYVGADGEDLLFENRATGGFAQVYPFPAQRGTSIPPHDASTAMSVGWVDFDGDGRLDLHVANGENCVDDPPPAPDFLYRNLGGDRFANASALLPAGPSEGATLDALWLDYDGDGDQDLYLGNDDLSDRPNALLENNTGAAFVDASAGSGAGVSRSTMGVAAGDVDGNGLPDLASTDIGREALLLQGEGGRFTEVAAEHGFGRERNAAGAESITWGLALADFDDDGDLDAFSAGGSLGLERGSHDDALYENDGRGSFRRFGVAAPGQGRTVAPGDWDRDGDVDLVVAQLRGRPLLLENRGRRSGHWLELRLVGRRSPREACGASLRLATARGEQWRQVECRAGDHVVHFGLGRERARRLTIRWPSRTVQRLAGPPVDRLVTVREPIGEKAAGEARFELK